MQFVDQGLAQHRAGIGPGAHAAGAMLAAQLRHHRGVTVGPEIGDQKGVLDLLPGLLVEIAAAEQTEHAPAEAFCDLASRPRSRSRRPSAGAIVAEFRLPRAGAAAAGSDRGRRLDGRRASGSGSWTSEIGRLGASRGSAASSPTAGSPVVVDRGRASSVRLNVIPDDAV